MTDLRIYHGLSFRDWIHWIYDKLFSFRGTCAFYFNWQNAIYFHEDKVWKFIELDDYTELFRTLEHEMLHRALDMIGEKKASIFYDWIFNEPWRTIPGECFQ